MGFLSNTAKLAMAGSLALYTSTSAVGAAALTIDEWRTFSSPAYQEFRGMVQHYQWKDAVYRLGLGGSEAELIMLSYDIMYHEGRPDGFGLEDLGQVGCLPGKEGGLPVHDNLGACHAVCRHEDDHDGLPKPKRAPV